MTDDTLEIARAALVETLAAMVAEAIETGTEGEAADTIDRMRQALQLGADAMREYFADMEAAARRLRTSPAP
jgi:hypothetical protein